MICRIVFTALSCAFFLGGAVCSAQCGDRVIYTRLPCVEGTTCRSEVFIGTVTGGDLYYESCESVSCCGKLFSSCDLDGGSCSLLKDPVARERIAKFAETSRVLVADCTGRYTRYAPRPARYNVAGDFIVDERILR